MKIAVLSSGSYKSILALRVVALAKHLAQQEGNQVTVVAPSADKYNNFIPDHHPKLESVRVVQPWQPATKNAIINLLPFIPTAAAAVLRLRPDIIYLCKPTPITVVGLLAKLLFKTPVILDLDDLGAEVMRMQGQSKFQYKLVDWCERLALRHADGVVVASTYLHDWVKQKYPTKPVNITPNGVEPGDYHVSKNTTPRPAVYYFGAINRVELVESLVRAAPLIYAAHPDTLIQIIGGGAAVPAVRKLAEDLGVGERIKFSDGWIDFLAIQKYVQWADIGICMQPDITTVRAASIMKIFQYMAMGSTQVVSDVGDLADYVGHGSAGLVVPAGDVEALASAVIDLLDDPNKRLNQATVAWELAQTKYSWAARTEKLSEFMSTILVKHLATPSLTAAPQSNQTPNAEQQRAAE